MLTRTLATLTLLLALTRPAPTRRPPAGPTWTRARAAHARARRRPR